MSSVTHEAELAVRLHMRKLEASAGSAVFVVLNPGLMGVVVPGLLAGWRSSDPPRALQLLGGALIVAGASLVLATTIRFVREGSGTPHPIAPTERLVVGGLYRYVRNPMYLGVVAAIVGQALLLGHAGLLIYATAFWLLVAGFVYAHEEPTLAARYGDRYAAYRRAVPPWWPRMRPWSPESPSPEGSC